ncbi:MAG: DUF2069 domain-containing protein [Nevskia sp.]|nr:DUF2069 domain-containing protein [Nevskia sp.]
MSATTTPLSRYAWFVLIACHAVLIAGLWVWAGPITGAMLVLPLLLAVPGLLKAKRYTAGWMTLLISAYVAVLLSEAQAVPSRYDLAVLFSVIAAVEFAALVLFVRWSARENGVARI